MRSPVNPRSRTSQAGTGPISLCIAMLGVAAGASPVFAQVFDFQWTGNAGTTTWADENNWRNLSFGGIVLGFPDGDDDVSFVGDVSIGAGLAPVFIVKDGATLRNLETLTAAANGSVRLEGDGSLVGGVLDFPQGGSLSGGVPTPPDAGFFRDLLIRGTCDIEGNLSGAITIEADARLRGGIAFSPGGLEIDPVRGALLEGTGQVWLTVRPGESSPYSFTRLVGLPDARADLVNRLDNGIVGYGGFSHLQLTNETLIHATGTQPIEFFDTIVDNTQGTIRIDTQGVVLLKNQSWIEGGRIEGSPGAELGGGTAFSIDRVGIRDVEIVGTLRVQGDEETGLAGDIILNGEIRNARGNFDGGMIVRDTDTARIVGGTITLDTPAFQYFWYGSLQTDPDAMLILDGTLLTGDGLLGPGSFTNRGIIHPGLGASGMVLSDVLIDNTQGRIEIPSGGFLWIAGFNDEGSTITGGVIDAEPGAGMSADNQIVTLEDVTITGALSLGDPDNFSSTTTPATYIRGTLTNNAEITVVDEGPDAPDPGHWFRVWCEETASIGGTGRLVMNDRALGGIAGRCSEGGTLINLAPHEISGAGRVAFITLDNRGTLTIEGGTLELFRATLLSEPPVTIASDGVLRIDDSHARVQAFEGTQGLVELVSGSLETGNLAGSLRHEGGRLVAGFEGTPTRIEGSYEQINPAAEIGITLSPTSQTAPLVVEGPTTLAGDLVVDFDPGFAPQPGDVFPILDARAGLAGSFAALQEGAVVARFGQTEGFGGVELTITYLAGDGDDIELRTRPGPCSEADIAPPFAVLDQADLTGYIERFLASDADADLTHDGLVDLADIVAFVSAFAAGCP